MAGILAICATGGELVGSHPIAMILLVLLVIHSLGD